MKVSFTAPSLAYREKHNVYELIGQAIVGAGHSIQLAGDYATLLDSVGDGSSMDLIDWQILCERELRAVELCDAAIFDVTNKATFGVGYAAALALNLGKPTLFLMQEGSLEGSMISGLRHEKLKRAYYNGGNVVERVESFLDGVRV